MFFTKERDYCLSRFRQRYQLSILSILQSSSSQSSLNVGLILMGPFHEWNVFANGAHRPAIFHSDTNSIINLHSYYKKISKVIMCKKMLTFFWHLATEFSCAKMQISKCVVAGLGQWKRSILKEFAKKYSYELK